MNILILCTGNSCRSQIAHGFLDQLTDNSISVFSAGVEKHGLNKNAVKCMAEIGIDISNYTSNLVDEYINKQFDFIITVCDNAKETCPIFIDNNAKKIHKNDEVRVIRALEIYEKTGRKMSEIFSDSPKNSISDKFNIIQFCISIDREIIHERIKKRLIKIIELGLIDEAKKLLTNYDLDLNHPIRRSINYKQAFEFIEKKYDYETFFDKALFATRQFAKRQTTWIRSWNKFEQIDPTKPENIINSVKKLITVL